MSVADPNSTRMLGMVVQGDSTAVLRMQERYLGEEDLEAWPLLRPDRVASLPNDILRASLAELNLMCGQTLEKAGGSRQHGAGEQAVKALDLRVDVSEDSVV